MATLLNRHAYQRTLCLAQDAYRGLLRRGSSNKRAVRALQERLSNLGFEVENDGIFGSETEAVVKHLQKKTGAAIDGIVGPETLGKLLRSKRGKPVSVADVGIDAIQQVVESGAPRTERTGRRLGDVRAVQRGGGAGASIPGRQEPRGRSRGAASQISKGPQGGRIDPVTGAEVATPTTGSIGSTDPNKPSGRARQLQKTSVNQEFARLHPRGGAGTAEGGRFIKKGDSGTPVERTQQRLNRAAGADLKEDGIFGNRTEATVKRFQSQHGLEVDGIVGPRTTAALIRQLRRIRKAKSG